MIKLKEQGLAKSIGVSNFWPAHLEVLLESSVPPAVNQVEWHAYLQRPALVDFAKRHNIALSAFASLTPIRKAAPGPLDPVLEALARKYGVSESEILIRLDLDLDITAVTTSSKESRLSDYLRTATFKFTPEEVKELKEVGAKKNFRAFNTQKYAENDWS
jgi:diketogulonate reductase-like aldo/keto reductase